MQKQRRLVEIHTAAFSSLGPVYGILLSSLLFGEIPAVRTVLGGMIFLWAAVSLTLEEAKKGSL